MTEENPNAEPSSPAPEKSEEIASSEAAEIASVSEGLKSQGKLDPEVANTLRVEEKKDPDKKDPEKKEDPKKEDPENVGKKNPNAEDPDKKDPSKKDEHLTDEVRDQKLFGEETKEEKGKLDASGDKDLDKAQEKFFEKFEEAYEKNDEDVLKEINSIVESKPKLAEKVSTSLFDLWVDDIGKGEKDSIEKLASLAKVAPKLADTVAAKFWRGEGDEKKNFDGVKDLFEFMGFDTDISTKKETKKESNVSKESQKNIILKLDLKLSDVAHEIGQSLSEFKKTPLYDKFIDASGKFTQKGMEVDEFWDTVKKAVLADKKSEEAKKKGAEEQITLTNASFSGPSGQGDDTPAKGGGAFSPEANNMLDAFGVDKKKVAARIAKNKK